MHIWKGYTCYVCLIYFFSFEAENNQNQLFDKKKQQKQLSSRE